MTFVSVPWDGSENDMYEHEWRRYHGLWGDGLISVGSREVSRMTGSSPFPEWRA